MNQRVISPAQSKFAELRAWGDALATRLEAAATQVHVAGVPPEESLVAELRRLHSTLQAFVVQFGLAEEGLAVDNWETLEKSLRWREYRLDVAPLLADVRRIRHGSGAEYPPLESAHHLADRLLQSLAARTGDTDQLQSLISGEHGLGALVRLVSTGDDLGDDDWERDQQLIARDLSRALAVAAARGQLQLQPSDRPRREDDELSPLTSLPLSLSEIDAPPVARTPDTQTPAAVESAAPPQRAPAISNRPLRAEPEPPQRHLPAVQPDVAFDDAFTVADSVLDDWPTEGSERRRLAKLELPQLAEQSTRVSAADTEAESIARPERAQPDLTTSPSDNSELAPAGSLNSELEISAAARSIAQRACRTGGVTREQAISELTWRLTYDGSAALAWQLGRASEAVYGRPGFPSAQTLRLWTLGSHIDRPHGPLTAALIECVQSLAEHPIDASGAGAEAETILRAAGLLRVAVIAPDTDAGDQWLACARQLAEPALVEYAETVLQVGYELQAAGALDRSQIGLARTPAGRLRELQRRARLWLDAAPGPGQPIRRTEPLFAEPHWTLRIQGLQRNPSLAPQVAGWLHALRMSHTLLQPVLQHDLQSRPEVRTLVNRIHSKLLIGARTDYPGGIDAIIVPDESIAGSLRGAAEIAGEWVELGLPQLDSTPQEDSIAGDSLLVTLADRQAAVLSAWQLRVLDCDDAPRQTAIGCLMLMVDQVAELVSSPPAAGDQTPNERDILSEHLAALGIADVGPSGLPACSDADLLQQLLLALSAGAPVNGGPLAVDTVADPERPESNGNVLWDERPEPWEGTRPAESRTDGIQIQQELQSLEQVLNQAVAEGRLSPHDHAGFASRLGAIRSEPVNPLNDLVQRNELILLRKRLELRGINAAESARNAADPTERSDAAASVLLDD